jgi:hypothetical protein
LAAGTYDLTPDLGYAYGGKEELTVLDNGEGIHRTVIKPGEVKTELFKPELYGADRRDMPSGAMVQLPTDRTRLTIIGQKINSPEVFRLFSIIHWTA